MEWHLDERLTVSRLDLVPAIHHYDVVTQRANGRDVVADEEVGNPQIATQITQQFENRRPYHGIQCRGHFVTEDQIRLRGERPRQVDPLFLPAGQLARAALRDACRQLHQLQ
ncbi:hypothetical protein D3C81_1891840 [compost metagenome]